MTSAPAVDGPDGTDVAADPLAASLLPEVRPPPEVSILQPASVSVAVTSTAAADRAVIEAITRRGSMQGSLSGAADPGWSMIAPAIPATRKVSRLLAFRLRTAVAEGMIILPG